MPTLLYMERTGLRRRLPRCQLQRRAFRLEPFDPQRHLAQGGWTLPAITLFDEPGRVSPAGSDRQLTLAPPGLDPGGAFCVNLISSARSLLRFVAVIMQQQQVTLRCGDNLVTFDWPTGADEVTIAGSLSHTTPTVYSVQEAYELFWALIDAGAY
jgi:hypothetical protein